MLAGAPSAAMALTDAGVLSAALPPAVAPAAGFAGGTAAGWSFAQAGFVDADYRDPDPAVPSLHGYEASFTTRPLAIGTVAEVVTLLPRLRGRDEAIASLDTATGGLNASALGVFDIASAQNFANHSVTIGGGEFGRHFTFKFAGQIGGGNDD